MTEYIIAFEGGATWSGYRAEDHIPQQRFVGELIRCKDCEYFKPMSIYGHGLCDVHCNGAGEPEVVSETYYCAWAERKDE